jgi:hypothetical protein
VHGQVIVKQLERFMSRENGMLDEQWQQPELFAKGEKG